MLALIKRYFLQMFFALSVVFGLQLPHFLQQYELRLQGHFVEAKLQLAQYQSLADIHFSGDLNALIAKHKESRLILFRDEAAIIEKSYLRVQYLQQKINNMAQPIWYRLGLLTKEIGQPIFQDTWKHYKPNIVLNLQSIMVGFAVAVLFMLLLEFMLYLVKSVLIYFKKTLFE